MPEQVLSKSFKIVPIMIMGKILGNKEYPFYDYVVAGVIALGITLFLVRLLVGTTLPLSCQFCSDWIPGQFKKWRSM